MNAYRFTPQAEDDLFEIWAFITSDSLEAADHVEAAVHEACALLAARWPSSSRPSQNRSDHATITFLATSALSKLPLSV